MKRNQAVQLQDTKVDVKVVLSGLWVSMLFVFAYVDIFGFWRADVVKGALEGRVPGVGIAINQTFLVLITIYVVVPSLMVAVSLLAPARAARMANLVFSLIYLVTVVYVIVGESWIYYILGSVVEALLLLAIARVAWTWPRLGAREGARPPIRNRSASVLSGPAGRSA